MYSSSERGVSKCGMFTATAGQAITSGTCPQFNKTIGSYNDNKINITMPQILNEKQNSWRY